MFFDRQSWGSKYSTSTMLLCMNAPGTFNYQIIVSKKKTYTKSHVHLKYENFRFYRKIANLTSPSVAEVALPSNQYFAHTSF